METLINTTSSECSQKPKSRNWDHSEEGKKYMKEYNKKYREVNKDKINQLARNYHKTDKWKNYMKQYKLRRKENGN